MYSTCDFQLLMHITCLCIIIIIQVFLSCNGSVFLTHCLSWTPPSFLSPLLRTFSIPLPDTHLCLRTHCLALGLKGARVLISRLESLISLVNSQMYVIVNTQHTCTVYYYIGQIYEFRLDCNILSVYRKLENFVIICVLNVCVKFIFVIGAHLMSIITGYIIV